MAQPTLRAASSHRWPAIAHHLKVSQAQRHWSHVPSIIQRTHGDARGRPHITGAMARCLPLECSTDETGAESAVCRRRKEGRVGKESTLSDDGGCLPRTGSCYLGVEAQQFMPGVQGSGSMDTSVEAR
jgi:hypothetical protein